MRTSHVKASETEERWFIYDASEHVLGRMAADIATRLIGKDRPTYTPSEHGNTHVVVINAARAVVTGDKNQQKEYQTYSGYPGGRSVLSLEKVREKRPLDIVTLAVRRMLPKNRLGHQMLRHLKVYADANHRHQAQTPTVVESTIS